MKIQITKQISVSKVPTQKTKHGNVVSAQTLKQCEKIAILAILKTNAPITGEEVSLLRRHLGLSVRAFARILKVSHVAILKWEKSSKPLDIYTQIALKLYIAEVFNIKSKVFSDLVLRP